MYSWKNIFTKSPEEVKVAALAIVGVVLALFTDVDPSLLETVGAGIALERFLNLVYVAPTQRHNVEAIALQGVELGKKLGGDIHVNVEAEVPARKRKGKDSGQVGGIAFLCILVAIVCIILGLVTTAKWMLLVALVAGVVGFLTRARV